MTAPPRAADRAASTVPKSRRLPGLERACLSAGAHNADVETAQVARSPLRSSTAPQPTSRPISNANSKGTAPNRRPRRSHPVRRVDACRADGLELHPARVYYDEHSGDCIVLRTRRRHAHPVSSTSSRDHLSHYRPAPKTKYLSAESGVPASEAARPASGHP
jgi:hypothetical protein